MEKAGSKSSSLLLIFVIVLSLAVLAVFFLVKDRLVRPVSQNQEYVVTSQLNTYVNPDEKTYRSYLITGKTFRIVGQKGDWRQISVYEPHFKMSWQGWIKNDLTKYRVKTENGLPK